MWLDTLTKNGLAATGLQKRDNKFREEVVMYPFFAVLTVLAISSVAYLFYFNQLQHSQQVAHLGKLLNEARAEIRYNTACALGIKR